MRQRPIWMVVLLAAVIVVGFTAVSSGLNPQEYERAHFDDWIEMMEEEGEDEEEEFTPNPNAEPVERGIFASIVMLLYIGSYLLIGAFAVGLMLWGILRYLFTLERRKREREEVLATPDDQRDNRIVADAIDASLADINTGVSVREAIIACWVTLEHACSEVGVRRRISDSPLALVNRLLDERNIDSVDISKLFNLYMRARHSTDELDERDREAARAYLQSIRDQLPLEVNQ